MLSHSYEPKAQPRSGIMANSSTASRARSANRAVVRSATSPKDQSKRLAAPTSAAACTCAHHQHAAMPAAPHIQQATLPQSPFYPPFYTHAPLPQLASNGYNAALITGEVGSAGMAAPSMPSIPIADRIEALKTETLSCQRSLTSTQVNVTELDRQYSNEKIKYSSMAEALRKQVHATEVLRRESEVERLLGKRCAKSEAATIVASLAELYLRSQYASSLRMNSKKGTSVAADDLSLTELEALMAAISSKASALLEECSAQELAIKKSEARKTSAQVAVDKLLATNASASESVASLRLILKRRTEQRNSIVARNRVIEKSISASQESAATAQAESSALAKSTLKYLQRREGHDGSARSLMQEQDSFKQVSEHFLKQGAEAQKQIQMLREENQWMVSVLMSSTSPSATKVNTLQPLAAGLPPPEQPSSLSSAAPHSSMTNPPAADSLSSPPPSLRPAVADNGTSPTDDKLYAALFDSLIRTSKVAHRF